MKVCPAAIRFVCVVMFALLAACQRPAPAPENQPAPAPPPLEGEALKQRQQQIALDAREIIQRYRYSMAMQRNPDSINQILEEVREIDQWYRDSAIVTNTYGIWRAGDQTLDIDGAYDYLKPSEFPELPAEIASWLEERDYTIPQVIPRADTLYMPELARPHNAFGRQLSDKEQTDWLVYCNAGQKASIYIFWNGTTQNVEYLNELLHYLEIDCCHYLVAEINPPVISRELADMLDIENQHSPPRIHHGISIGLPDSPSIQNLYKTNGKWIFFTDYE